MLVRFLFSAVLLASLAATAFSDDAAKAAELFEAGKFAEAKPLYEKLVKTEGAAGTYMRLAFCRLESGDPAGAIDSYKVAIEKGGPEGHARYNMACAYARLGKKDRALDELEKACSANFGRAHMLKADADFASLKEEKRFKELLEKISHPTKGIKGADAMDLWIGEWDVYTNGQLAGHNVVRKALDGFAVEELWTSRRGSKGQSLFTFDSAKGQWKQLWVDDRGWTVEKVGVPIENGIRFEGWSLNVDGSKQRAKTTLSKNPDGTVRQLIEFEDKDGKWSVVFDGKYVRKK
jgi:tetratricopeptide (TPR) repeat protein